MKDFVRFPLIHPAAALHQGGLLDTLKADFKKLKEFLDRNTKPAESTPAASPAAPTLQIDPPYPTQQQLFMYLKIGLKAYKSRRADPDAWIIGGYATKEVIDRAKFQPQLVGPDVKKENVAFLGTDPGDDVTEGWWDEMLVQWFDVPEEEKPAEGEEEGKADETESAAAAEERSSKA